MNPESEYGKLALVGYAGLDRYPDGTVVVEAQFRVGRLVWHEQDKEPRFQQFAVEELTGEGVWECNQPLVVCTRPETDEDDELAPCWFACLELHPCALELTNSATGETIEPDFCGVRLSRRKIEEVDPATGIISGYRMFDERYLTPREIDAFLDLGALPSE